MTFNSDHSQHILLPRDLQYKVCDAEDALQALVVIGITLCDQRNAIRRSLTSALRQDCKNFSIILLDDNSGDDWQTEVNDLLMDPRIIIVKGNCGSPARARNAILDFVDENMPLCRWVARLDADDRLASSRSLSSAIQRGKEKHALFIIGSNSLVKDKRTLPNINLASEDLLLNPRLLQQFISQMSQGQTDHELPSCNLIIRARSGIRYPNVQSAEDHWLVAQLLLLRGQEGVIHREPIYAEYTLDGVSTKKNKNAQQWSESRQSLANVTATWLSSLQSGGVILGHGMEGIVIKNAGYIEKTFYSHSLNEDGVQNLRELLVDTLPFIPEPTWHKNTLGQWVCKYPDQKSEPVVSPLNKKVLFRFLLCCLKQKVIPRNIKRTNFRIIESGDLCYIDIGSSINHFSVSSFRDIAARIYCQLVLGWADEELVRRESIKDETEVLSNIPGLMEFYLEILDRYCSVNQAETTAELMFT